MAVRTTLRRLGALVAVMAGLAVWGAPAADAHPDGCLVWAQWPVHLHLVCS